jgi:hypothetical protein
MGGDKVSPADLLTALGCSDVIDTLSAIKALYARKKCLDILHFLLYNFRSVEKDKRDKMVVV